MLGLGSGTQIGDLLRGRQVVVCLHVLVGVQSLVVGVTLVSVVGLVVIARVVPSPCFMVGRSKVACGLVGSAGSRVSGVCGNSRLVLLDAGRSGGTILGSIGSVASGWSAVHIGGTVCAGAEGQIVVGGDDFL